MMIEWSPQAMIEDFKIVAGLAGSVLTENAIIIENLRAPHLPPTKLPTGRMAVYVFHRDHDVLKVGKVGAKSQARYTSQHYSPRSAQSTLAASILSDKAEFNLLDVDETSVGHWIKNNINRTNFLMDERLGIPLLTLLETFLHCRLKPLYEGFKSQRI